MSDFAHQQSLPGIKVRTNKIADRINQLKLTQRLPSSPSFPPQVSLIRRPVRNCLRTGTHFEQRAKPGYAVNGISSRVGAGYDDLQVSFARVTKTGLDTLCTYSSTVVGAPRGPDAVPTVMTSGDQPIVGIFGHAGDYLHGLGLISAK